MKKIKYGVFALILVCACFFMSACDLFKSKPRVEELVVRYTRNLEFFIGENYHDDLLQGTAIYTDKTEKDVTEIMKVDTSDYDNTKVGTYEIKFTYDGIVASYNVKVVDKTTDSVLINNRMIDVINQTFTRTNNVLSFEASNSAEYLGVNFSEEMIYIDDAGDISAYVVWCLDEVTFQEFYFNGTRDSGVLAMNTADGGLFEYPDFSLEEFSMVIIGTASEQDCPAILNPSDVLVLEESSYSGELSVDDGVFTLVKDEHSLQYKNNKIFSLNGADITFPKKISTTIPPRNTIQGIMDEVVQESYQRTDGQLQITAGSVVDLGNSASMDHNFVIQENNGEYLIYNNFTVVGVGGSTNYECWFEGSLESAKITSRVTIGSNEGSVSCADNKSLDEFMELLYAYQLGLNQNGINYEISLFPYNMILLEISEFSGLLEVHGGVWTLTQEVEEGVEFTLNFIDNQIVEVNGYDVIFSDTISIFAIPSVPSVA